MTASRFKKGTLAALVGLGTATLLYSTTPREESGRTVTVAIASDGYATVRHLSGPQYLRAYRDIAGVPTACDGIIDGVRMGQTYTETQCTGLLTKALLVHAEGVMTCTPGLSLTVPRRDNVRAAAVSLAYNVGIANWCASTARRRLDAGDVRGACDAFLLWNKARVAGQLRVVAGLTARRTRERALCLKDA